MILTMLMLRIAYVSLLAIAVVWLSPTAYRSLTRHTRGNDMLFMIFWGLCFNRLWFVFHSVRFNDPPQAGLDFLWLVSSYVFAIALVALLLVGHYWERQNDRG